MELENHQWMLKPLQNKRASSSNIAVTPSAQILVSKCHSLLKKKPGLLGRAQKKMEMCHRTQGLRGLLTGQIWGCEYQNKE